MINVLQIGQSNAVGYGLGGILGTSIDGRVTAWNNNNTATARTPGTRFIKPLLGSVPLHSMGPYQNAGIWFCSKLAKMTGENVKFMLVARGATGLEAFDDRTPNPYLLTEVRLNWQNSGNGPADFLIHCGHENNRADSYASYADKQDHILARLLADRVISDSTVIILTGLAEREADHKALNDNVLRPYCAARGYCYAESGGLEQQALPDLSHFSGQSYVQMGMDRIFDALPESAYQIAPLSSDVTAHGVASTGEYWVYADGSKRVRWAPFLERYAVHSLYRKWDFPVSFRDAPHISFCLTSMTSADMAIDKIGGSCFMLDNYNGAWAQLRLQSNNLYASGAERMGVILEAVGV